MEILYVLALLACPVGMGLMMWVMMRRGKQPEPGPATSPRMSESDAEVARLRAEIDQLRADLDNRGTPPAGAERPR